MKSAPKSHFFRAEFVLVSVARDWRGSRGNVLKFDQLESRYTFCNSNQSYFASMYLCAVGFLNREGPTVLYC